MYIQEILSSTVVGSVGSSSQIWAGRSYTITELTTKFGVANVDAYYTFPATDLLNDQSANAVNLTGSNVTDADNTTGIMNTNFAVDLNGTDEYMYENGTFWDTMPTALCINFWFLASVDGQPAADAYFVNKQGSGTTHEFHIYLDTLGTINFDTEVGAAAVSMPSTTTLPNGANTVWHMCTINWDTTNGKRIWIDGKLENQDATATTLCTGGATQGLTIGRLSSAASNYFGGKLANMLFADYVLTQADVDWLYGTALSLPSALQGKNFSTECFMKEAVAGSTRQVWCDEVVRESTRMIVSGGTRRSTDYYNINGKF